MWLRKHPRFEGPQPAQQASNNSREIYGLKVTDLRQLAETACSGSAHVTPGASGEHVGKIQAAMLLLDGAAISPDEVQRTSYGASTARAVLAYKQKRNIINRNYQTQADAIVGKMTMASLDSEMLRQEAVPRSSVQIKPLSFSSVRPPRSLALVSLLNSSQSLGLNVAGGSLAVSGPSILRGPNLLPNTVLELGRNSVGSIVVIGGSFGDVTIRDPDIVKIAPDGR